LWISETKKLEKEKNKKKHREIKLFLTARQAVKK